MDEIEHIIQIKCKMFIYMFFKHLQTYQGSPSQASECQYHPGVPIFHEGLKFWSCCQRKTTDFQSFLDQAGCQFGTCKWKKESVSKIKVK